MTLVVAGTLSDAVPITKICYLPQPTDLTAIDALGFEAVLCEAYEPFAAARHGRTLLPHLFDIDLSEPRNEKPSYSVQDSYNTVGNTDLGKAGDASAVTAWTETLTNFAERGAAGFRFQKPGKNFAITNGVARNLRKRFPELTLILDAPGLAWRDLGNFPSGLYTYCTSSLPWWDFRSPWLGEEYECLKKIAPVIALATGQQTHTKYDDLVRILLSAVTGSGVIIPYDPNAENIPDIRKAILSANSLIGSEPVLKSPGALRIFRTSGHTVILRTADHDKRFSSDAFIAAVGRKSGSIPLIDRTVIADLEDFSDLDPVISENFSAEDGTFFSVSLYRARRLAPARPSRPPQSALSAAAQPRIVIDAVMPSVDNGRYPAKRIAGETVDVEATIFTDGHPVIAAELLYRPDDETSYRRAPLRLTGNDRWSGQFPLRRTGRHNFRIEAWIDRYGTFLRDISKKFQAGKEIDSDLGEGQSLIEKAYQRADDEYRNRLSVIRTNMKAANNTGKFAILSASETQRLMFLTSERTFLTQSRAFPVDVDRKAAIFASWYEIFPRSAGTTLSSHGTFRDVIADLPRIAAMGFDVLYFPPIHPIGKTNRKGPNNTLAASADDVGSVYAIGSSHGGHDAIHPRLGTIDDFRALVAAAQARGIEIALDFAIQCSPDHPWLKEHPGWFEWRPDGSIKYAENPPKIYEDIVNVDFFAEDSIPALWEALRDIVLFWAREGIRIFRVDNPHTKPFAFWEWLIGEIRRIHPDVIFLAEAFARPATMYQLGKIGFSQSYTYFTWRNTKSEITSYIEEISQPSIGAFFRPHFFVNTPDINPAYLQTSGRAGFLIRAALAATLSGLWGIFSGFEICEAEALPGREEYLDSDKYQIRKRDWDSATSIASEIAKLNRLRQYEPALQSHMGTTFHNASNDQIIYYSKHPLGYAYRILVMVSLDPHNDQTTEFEVPLWEFELGDEDSVAVTDLLSDTKFVWRGKMQRATLSPAMPFRIWKISSLAGGFI